VDGINLIPRPYVSFPNLTFAHVLSLFLVLPMWPDQISCFSEKENPFFPFHIFIISSRLMFHVKLTVRNFLKISLPYCYTKIERENEHFKTQNCHYCLWNFRFKKIFYYLFIFCMKTINVHLLIINAILYFVAPIVCLLYCHSYLCVRLTHLYMHTTNLYFH